MEKFIEIPEGYEARIDGSKIVLEPKESDDDRIRKDLVNFIRGALLCEFNRTEYLDWIEKHKEQKSVDYAEELKKCKDNSLYFFDKYVKIKLKPEDWSDEDEAAYCDLIWCIEQARKSAKDENDIRLISLVGSNDIQCRSHKHTTGKHRSSFLTHNSTVFRTSTIHSIFLIEHANINKIHHIN